MAQKKWGNLNISFNNHLTINPLIQNKKILIQFPFSLQILDNTFVCIIIRHSGNIINKIDDFHFFYLQY